MSHRVEMSLNQRPCVPYADCMPKGRTRLSNIELHPERAKIEFDMARGVPVRTIESRYGVSKSAISRWQHKLPPQLRAAALKIRTAHDHEKLKVEESEGLLANLATQRARLLLMQDGLLEIGDLPGAARISSVIGRNLELVGKYLGEFALRTVSTNVNVLIQPEYLELRTSIAQALAPFPEARRAVAEVLHRLESKAAATPTPNVKAPLLIDGRPADAA